MVNFHQIESINKLHPLNILDQFIVLIYYLQDLKFFFATNEKVFNLFYSPFESYLLATT